MKTGEWYEVRLDGYPQGFMFKAGQVYVDRVEIEAFHPPKDPGVAQLASFSLKDVAEVLPVDGPIEFKDGDLIYISDHPEDDIPSDRIYFIRIGQEWFGIDDHCFDDDGAVDRIRKHDFKRGSKVNVLETWSLL